MSGIVCAIRGGPESEGTIQKAVTLSRDSRLPLYFLYIVNVDFLTQTSQSRTHTISKELHQMGAFILEAACARAAAQGVEARAVVREGDVGDEIVSLCQEIGAEYVVLGRPRTKDEQNVFTHDALQAFAERIEKEAGARVLFAEVDRP